MLVAAEDNENESDHSDSDNSVFSFILRTQSRRRAVGISSEKSDVNDGKHFFVIIINFF